MDAHLNRLTDALPGWRGRSSSARVIGILPGEGIGPEVLAVADDVLRAVSRRHGLDLDVRLGGPIGTSAEKTCGKPLSAEVEAFCASIFAAGGALLCGPGGSRFVYDLRARFGLFCKLIPVRPLAVLDDTGALRPAARADVDLVIVRENVSGCYFGKASRNVLPEGEEVCHTFRHRSDVVRRLVTVAAELAQRRRGGLTLVVKPSGLPEVSQLWQEQFHRAVKGRALATRILEVDNAGYQLIAAGQQFDVVVAPNLFGDILGDGAALLLGSRGLSYSGNFGAPGVAVYQTGHGAAWDLAGQDVANPLGQLFALAMMLRESFGLDDAAASVESAIVEVLRAGVRTVDLRAPGATIVGTREMGRHIAAAIEPALPCFTTAGAELSVPVAVVSGVAVSAPHLPTVERPNPSNWSETLAFVPLAGSEEVRAASSPAGRLTRDERAALLAAWADTLTTQAETLAQSISREVGKPLADARGEVRRAVGHIQTARQLLTTPHSQTIDADRRVSVRQRPQGVVAVITPWNNPVALAVGKIAPALALGNGVVWKPAVEAPRTALAVMDSLATAGVPPGLVNLVFGNARTAQLLIEQPTVDAVALTGSIAAGQSAAAQCLRLHKPLQAELGGNNSAIVWRATEALPLARAAFAFAGQRCTALRRFIVARPLLESFQEALVAATLSLRPATDIGPLISRTQRDSVLRVIEAAVQEGGRLLCGGTVPSELEAGCWLTPAVVTDMRPEAKIVQEETFGPVAVLLPADTFDEAIALANGVEQGLFGVLVGGDEAERRRYAESMRAGMLQFSAGPLDVHAAAPFGGWKASGIGPPEHGEWDRLFYARPQAVYGWLDGED